MIINGKRKDGERMIVEGNRMTGGEYLFDVIGRKTFDERVFFEIDVVIPVGEFAFERWIKNNKD